MKTQLLLTAVAALVAIPAPAATFNATVGTTNLTIIEADPFKVGDTAGNTVGVVAPATEWGSTTNSPSNGLWYERTASAFATGYESLPGATDRMYELNGGADRLNAPELQTSVTGLAAGTYEVFVVYISRDNASSEAGILANLNGAAVDQYDRNNATDEIDGGTFAASIASLGNTASNATGFDVNVKGYVEGASNRVTYIGVGYSLVPEPGSLALVGLGGLALIRRRRPIGC